MILDSGTEIRCTTDYRDSDVIVATMMNSDEVRAEYTNSLSDLTCNSRPLISMLTMLAEENLRHADVIVAAIEQHLAKVHCDVKLPILYLIDCIIKNINGTYTQLFTQNIVMTFCSVFKLVDEKTRAEMFKLRQTWNDIFPQKKLYAIDVQIHMLDPAWPVTAQPPTTNSIHFNPKFLKGNSTKPPPQQPSSVTAPTSKTTPVPPPPQPPPPPPPKSKTGNNTVVDTETIIMQQKLIQKQKELIELQQKKLELELLQTQVKLQKQMKAAAAVVVTTTTTTMSSSTAATNTTAQTPPGSTLVTVGAAKTNVLLKPEVAKQLMMEQQQQQKSGNIMSSGKASGGPITTAGTNRDPRLSRPVQLMNHNDVNLTGQVKPLPTTTTTTTIITTPISTSTDRNTIGTVVIDIDTKKEQANNEATNSIANKKIIVSTAPINNNNNNTNTNDNNNKTKGRGDRSPNNDSTNKKSHHHHHHYRHHHHHSKSSSPTKSKSGTTTITTNSSTTSNTTTKNSGTTDISLSSSSSSSTSLVTSPRKTSRKKSHRAEKKSQRDQKPLTTTTDPMTFKSGKGATGKSRNYMRRNRSPSFSPEPQDIDLRSNKFVDGKKDEKVPPVKKRPSNEPEGGGTTKKAKSEMFDVLFGNEDTDLRQLSSSTSSSVIGTKGRKISPPPPPIISLQKSGVEPPPKIMPLLPPNFVIGKKKMTTAARFDEIRAKLANATGRERFAPRESPPKRLKLSPPPPRRRTSKDDDDTRTDDFRTNQKFVVSADEINGIKSGDMTDEQRNHLMSKIIAQIEQHKLLEAQKNDDELTDPKFSDDEDDTCQQQRFVNKSSQFNQQQQRPIWQQHRKKSRFWDSNKNTGPPPPPTSDIPSLLQPKPWLTPWRPPFEAVPTPELQVDNANQDDLKMINIDGVPREIRPYGEVAIIFMAWDDPREISFQSGTGRRLYVDDDACHTLNFNEPYRDLKLKGGGRLYSVRLGAPSCELFVDGQGYECYFGGPPVDVTLPDGKLVTVKLDGPPPQVKIGTEKRTDLVAGKVNLMIDARIMVPVYLDGRRQKFILDGVPHTLQFVDALQTVLINDDIVFHVDFGGFPKPVTIRDRKHFMRFSVLPRGIRPGRTRIQGMLEGPATHQRILPPLTTAKIMDDTERNSNSPQSQHFNNTTAATSDQNDHLDVLSNMMMAQMTPSKNAAGYQQQAAPQITTTTTTTAAAVPSVVPALNINELFQKLVSTGILQSTTTSTTNNTTSTVQSTNEEEVQQPISAAPVGISRRRPIVQFSKPETLKIRQNQLFSVLYSGTQCSSCGWRFLQDHAQQYSQHLDWHFRQNRRGKKNVRIAVGRRWYYSLADWKNFEEFEDLEAREKNCYFDQPVSAVNEDDSTVNEDDPDQMCSSVPADPDVQTPRCELCQDRFDQFFNEEKEEWHLRNAIRVDNKTYHPVCYQDHEMAVLAPKKTVVAPPDDENETSTTGGTAIIPGLEIIVDDDDNESNNNNKTVTDDQIEDEETTTVEKEEEPAAEMANDIDTSKPTEEDDDVIINEVVPEKIVVHDDDDDEEEVEKEEAPILAPSPVDSTTNNENSMTPLFDLPIKIKIEPIDPDEEMVVEPPPPEPPELLTVEPTGHHVSSIDGNTEMTMTVPPTSALLVSTSTSNNSSDAVMTTTTSRIRINISKSLTSTTMAPSVVATVAPSPPHLQQQNVLLSETVIDPTQPLPPGEEPIQLNIKPALSGVELRKMPMVRKGSELTGMCSIM